MQPARRADIPVRVKNSYNPAAPGTIITNSRAEGSVGLVTAITAKCDVTMVDITSTRMLGAYGFLAKTFEARTRMTYALARSEWLEWYFGGS